MTLPMIVAATLALAVVLAWTRLVRAHRRDPGTPRAWRLAVLLALQPLLAGALYLVLLPPREAVAPTVLTILTEGASATQTPGEWRRAHGISTPDSTPRALHEGRRVGAVPTAPLS